MTDIDLEYTPILTPISQPSATAVEALAAALLMVQDPEGEHGPACLETTCPVAAELVELSPLILAAEPRLHLVPDDAVIVTTKALAAAIEDHFATGRHGWSYTSCATAVVMALVAKPKP